jgi:transcriptional regulator with XRE-family HTH domain
MTPADYRQLRERLGLTQGELAELVGVALNTVSRRELGQLPIQREAELALRFVAAQKHKNNSSQARKKA